MIRDVGVRLDVDEAFRSRAWYTVRAILSPYEVRVVEGTDLVCGEDLLRPAFSLLAREEEWGHAARDEHGRFPLAACSISLHEAPPVNRVSERIAQDLGLSRKPWPGGARFVVALTHDVDRLRNLHSGEAYGLLRRSAWHLLRKFRPGRALGDLGELIARALGPNRLWNFREMTQDENERGFRSTYFFSVGQEHEYDNRYDAASPEIRDLIRRLIVEGREVGLHRSIGCAGVEAERAKLAEIAGRPIRGNRCHYLKLDVPKDFGAFERAGLMYDTTLGFAEREGFRNGWTFPYHPYDPERERPFRLLEIPLAVMDTTLMDYEDLGPEEAWNSMRRVLEALRDAGGAAALLWHNGRHGAWYRLYRRALDFIAGNGGAGCAAEDLAAWWLERET